MILFASALSMILGEQREAEYPRTRVGRPRPLAAPPFLKPAPMKWIGRAILLLLATVVPLRAESIRITVENLQPADGFFFTPVWFGLHDGGFDLFDVGSAASSALETIAETGDAAPLGSLLTSANNTDGTTRFGTVVAAPAGFAVRAGV